MRTSYEACTADEECGVANYCWYASQEDRIETPPVKRCLPVYSQEDGTSFGWYSANLTKTTPFRSISFADYVRNGMYCKSGFAFPLLPNITTQANCTSVDKIFYNGA